MYRFRILHFPGPEMAGLSKKLSSKFEFFKTKKLRFHHSLIWQVFFQHCFTKQSKTMLKKLVKWENDEISNFFVLKNSNFEFSFLDNLAISGPGKCKIWNLCIKMSKTPKYRLWEMMGSFYYVSKISLWNLLGHIEHCGWVDPRVIFFIPKVNFVT